MTLVGITLFVITLCCSCESVFSFNINSFLLTELAIYSTVTVPPATTMLHTVEPDCLIVPYRQSLLPTSIKYSHIRRKRLFLMEQDIVTRALDSKTHVKRSRIPSVIYGKLNEEKLRPTGNSHALEQNLSNNINSIKTNIALPHSSFDKQTLNEAPSKRNYLLQYINNPSIYSIITNPVNKFTILTKSSTWYPNTRSTIYPITTTPPIHMNGQTAITPRPVMAPYVPYEQWTSNMYNNYEVMVKFMQSLDEFERKFYKVTFRKLSSISSAGRRENGISFVQSGLFLQLALLALSSEVDNDMDNQIEECINLHLTHMEKIYVLKEIVSSLPKSDDALKFRLSSRLILGVRQQIKPVFQHGLATALQLHIDRVNTTDSAEELTAALNKMIEIDSGGAMRDTFEEDELSEGLCAILLETMYLRPRWRSAPTVLNGTHAFLDADDAPSRFTRMIRINDIMRYTELNEWDAVAIEIFYATPGLSLLMVVPRGRSLRKLSNHLTDTSIHRVLEKMYSLRVAVSLPLYTLRMTLLLPDKLHSMGFSRLVDVGQCEDVRLSHGVQRLMFWAEAGRNAFKDDGIEWDEVPELEILVNRPYIFFVRWRNITIMNGNFVL